MENDAIQSNSALRRLLRASIIVLLLAPFGIILLTLGLVFLWKNPWLLKWLWIPLPICWGSIYLLLRLAKRRGGAIWQPPAAVLDRWTDRDSQAWQKVLQYADQTTAATTREFCEPTLYTNTTRELAQRLAEHYHPLANNPIENLTVSEILTAAELAVSDMRCFVEQNIPGSHLMTIRWLTKAPQATRLWNRIRPLYYSASLLWNPWNALSRAAANETVVSPTLNELKKDGLASLYRVFVLQLGKYLIELNSHRLRVGPDRWRELVGARPTHAATPLPRRANTNPQPQSIAPLQIAVVGQVKAGKSSLVNALIGDQQAAVDILPLTASITKYRVTVPGTTAPLVLLDTVGYAHGGLSADRVEETMRVVCRSAMTLLVINITDPARQPDCEFLQTMETWFAKHPERKKPPVLAVTTHIDLLSPQREWSPPYDGWLRPHPRRPKERSIREGVETIQELMQHRIHGVVPACTDADHGQAYGVTEWVIPALLNLLPQATSKQLLDTLYDQPDRSHVTQLITQLFHAAKLLAKYQFCGPATLWTGPEQPSDTDNDD